MVNNIYFKIVKNSPYFLAITKKRIIMKNYKFFLIILSLISLGGFLVVTYLDIPAPDKLETKIIDVNDEKIK